MDLRLTTKEDYKELCGWWDQWRWKDSKPSLELLDNLKYGLMVSLDGKNICAGFLYFTNASAFGLLEFIVSSPEIKQKNIRKEAIIFLICSLQEMAKRQGVKCLFSSLRSEALKKHYLDCGFVEGSKNTTEMIWRI